MSYVFWLFLSVTHSLIYPPYLVESSPYYITLGVSSFPSSAQIVSARLKISLDDGSSYSNLHTLAVSSANTYNYTTVIPGKSYYLKVSTTNNAGVISDSIAVPFVAGSLPTITAGSINIQYSGNTLAYAMNKWNILLGWGDIEISNGGSWITGYRLYYAVVGTFSSVTESSDETSSEYKLLLDGYGYPTFTEYFFSNLSTNTNYVFKLYVYNSVGRSLLPIYKYYKTPYKSVTTADPSYVSLINQESHTDSGIADIIWTTGTSYDITVQSVDDRTGDNDTGDNIVVTSVGKYVLYFSDYCVITGVSCIPRNTTSLNSVTNGYLSLPVVSSTYTSAGRHKFESVSSPSGILESSHGAISMLIESIQGNGLICEYFDSASISVSSWTDVCSNVNTTWYANTPIFNTVQATFGIRYTGYIKPTITDSYILYCESTGDSSCNISIAINFVSVSYASVSSPISLTANAIYPISVLLRDSISSYADDKYVKLYWSSNYIMKSIIPSDNFLYTSPIESSPITIHTVTGSVSETSNGSINTYIVIDDTIYSPNSANQYTLTSREGDIRVTMFDNTNNQLTADLNEINVHAEFIKTSDSSTVYRYVGAYSHTGDSEVSILFDVPSGGGDSYYMTVYNENSLASVQYTVNFN
jgi:PA14 domain